MVVVGVGAVSVHLELEIRTSSVRARRVDTMFYRNVLPKLGSDRVAGPADRDGDHFTRRAGLWLSGVAASRRLAH